MTISTLMQRLKQRSQLKQVRASWALLAAYLLMYQSTAVAAMPWETPLRQVIQSVCGPVVQAFAIGAVIATGIMIGFFEVKGWMQTLLIALFGIAIAVNAPGIMSLFGSTSMYSC